MATLQVRDFPEDLHEQLTALAEREHRSLAQQVLVLLKMALEQSDARKQKRARILDGLRDNFGTKKKASDPVKLIREDRDR
jgi:plasmid stability protein